MRNRITAPSCHPLNKFLMHRIMGKSYRPNSDIQPKDLRYLRLLYIDFCGETRIGEMICNYRIAPILLNIFQILYRNEYAIERIQLVDDFQADDDICCIKNNTSCFNYRNIAGTSLLSKHAYGLAVDVNPFYNPYVVGDRITPPGAESYANRNRNFPHKLGPGDLCYELFTENGFQWGGDWTHCKDYQHFEYVAPENRDS